MDKMEILGIVGSLRKAPTTVFPATDAILTSPAAKS